MKIINSVFALFIFASIGLSGVAHAQTAIYTVPMNHKEFRGQGQQIRLKNELRRVYTDYDFSQGRLLDVWIYAKSQQGNGSVELRVNGQSQDRKGVDGRPGTYASNNRNTYNNIRLRSYNEGRGQAWVLVLDGRIKVERIEVRARDVFRETDPGPSSRYVQVGQGSTIKIVPTSNQFQINQRNVEAIRIQAQQNLLVITEVEVRYSNGSREVLTALQGQLFAGQALEAPVRQNVRSVRVTALTAIPFGADATYVVQAKVRR